MKAVVLFFCSLINKSSSLSSIFECGQNQYCAKSPDPEWHIYRESAEVLAQLTTLAEDVHVYISKNKKNIELLNHRDLLCDDDTFTGFLLDVHVKNSTMACIWTGDGRKSSCSPVPIQYAKKTFDFLTKKNWRKRLLNFRHRIGCSDDNINKAGNVA